MAIRKQIPVYSSFNNSLQKLHLPKAVGNKPFHVFSWQYTQPAPIVYPLARQSYFDLTFFVKARFTHHLNDEAFSIDNHSLHLMAPGQAEYFETDTLSRPAGFGIYFYPAFIFTTTPQHLLEKELPFLKADSPRTFFFTTAQSARLQELFKKMLEEQENSQDSYAVIRHYLLLLLYKIKQFSQAYTQQRTITAGNTAVITSRFETELKKNYLRLTNVKAYARQLNLSARQLTNAIYLQTGKTPKQLLQETILLEVKFLLVHSEMTISEIAFHFNFYDVPHFTNFFKKRTGLSPHQFRQNDQ